jgi:hypothetical protein
MLSLFRGDESDIARKTGPGKSLRKEPNQIQFALSKPSLFVGEISLRGEEARRPFSTFFCGIAAMADKRKHDELLSPASRELESARLDVMQLKRQAKLRALELLADASGTKPAAASSSSAGTGSEATAAQREGPPDENDAVWNAGGNLIRRCA